MTRAEPDLHEQIADLEAEIDGLAHAAERCRKIIRAAKVAMVAGSLLTLLIVTGLLRLPPLAFVVGISAALGGIVIAGSNRSTLDEIAAAIRAQEARRAELIDAIRLRVIDGGLTPSRRP